VAAASIVLALVLLAIWLLPKLFRFISRLAGGCSAAPLHRKIRGETSVAAGSDTAWLAACARTPRRTKDVAT